MKYFKIFLLILVSFLLVGCIDKTETDDGKNDLVISLDENPSTGYGWSFYISDDSILKFVGDKYESDNNDSSIVGVGGTRSFTFRGLKEGETTVIFYYSRDWEEESINEITYIINVNKDKIASIKNTYEMNY